LTIVHGKQLSVIVEFDVTGGTYDPIHFHDTGKVIRSRSVGDTIIEFVCFILGCSFDGVAVGVMVGIVISDVSN
jgi:hypothetical protein